MGLSLDEFDQKLLELQKLKFDKRECPGCRGLMETPTPLKQGACPVCRAGKLVRRKTDERWCPICRSGALKNLQNVSPIKICPVCQTGRLRATGIFRRWLQCESCDAGFAKKGNLLTYEEAGKRKTTVEEGTSGDSDSFWLPLSGRSAKVVFCETCSAHWDELPDGGMSLFMWHDDPFGVARKYQSLTKSEWAKVGLRLKPDSGNMTCNKCDADFLETDGKVIPLSVEHDPYGFMAEYQGCKLPIESLRYLGVYKTSGKDGPVCAECRTEFDAEGDYLRLRAASNPTLQGYADQARPLEDWHRLARGLPAVDEEAQWRSNFDEALRRALLTGEISWADRKKPEILWRSDAQLAGSRGRMLLHPDRIEFQPRKNGWSAPRDVVRSVDVDGDEVIVDVVGEAEPLTFRIEPETVSVDLKSGRRQVVLDAADFADALRWSGGYSSAD